MKYIVIVVFVVILGKAYGQEGNIYQRIRQANITIYNIEATTVLVSQSIYNRFTSDTITIHQTFSPFKNSKDTFIWLSARLYGEILYQNNFLYLTSWNGDSFPPRNMGIVDLDRKHNSSFYSALNSIPTTKKGDFRRLRFSKPKLINKAPDSIVICQFDRKLKQTRHLTVNSKFQIIQVEVNNNDENRSDLGYKIDIQYFKHDCFDSLNMEYGLGTYYFPDSAETTVTALDTQTQSKVFSLLDGRKIELSNYKYIV
ncbi:MAG: hypothetical protein JXR19_06660 [Bacteroidia bacterium]